MAIPIVNHDPLDTGPAPEIRRIDRFRLEKDDNRIFECEPATQSWSAFRDGWTWRWGEYSSGIAEWRGQGATERWGETIYFA